ncbi:hypothetical protein [Sinomonas cyclohexanicum]|uniref:hypothetical protein n=1 Tax=Sinomonas cyclohexanicum TaxID=322009 RepID=UPI001E527545|nr:hypothetical protein [Corynebacterium cyclohexanicum]
MGPQGEASHRDIAGMERVRKHRPLARGEAPAAQPNELARRNQASCASIVNAQQAELVWRAQS